MIIAKIVAALIVGYLLGSIPFGVIIGKRFAKVDVRDYGSGKMGATNVLRVVGKKAAILALFCDVMKGALAVVFAWLILRGEYQVVLGSVYWWLLKSAPVLAALAAIAGHTWPIFLKFRGGRGVATFFGGLFALCPAAALFSGQVLVLGAGLTRLASLASISGAVATYVILVPLTVYSHFPIEYLAYALIGTITIAVTHRDNIARLLNGKERKIGENTEIAKPPPSPKSTG
jgi:glycerol-3-phosphate acyltransferase PlsY